MTGESVLSLYIESTDSLIQWVPLYVIPLAIEENMIAGYSNKQNPW